jgi:pSer/pThr/pTyr-binding forkhead associated (FHA) protein
VRLVYLGSSAITTVPGGEPAPGTAFELEPGRVISIGRSASNTIRLASPHVARAHALVTLVPGSRDRAVVCDLRSSCGTRVGGERVEVGFGAPGDAVVVGSFRFVLE